MGKRETGVVPRSSSRVSESRTNGPSELSCERQDSREPFVKEGHEDCVPHSEPSDGHPIRVACYSFWLCTWLSIAARSQTPTSRRVLGQPFVANLWLPAAKDRSAGVLVVGGSGGGIAWQDYWGEILSRQGFGALALAYFGMEGLPKELDEIPLEYRLSAPSTCSGNLKSTRRESAFLVFRKEAN